MTTSTVSIGIPKETRPQESRVAATPDSVKKLAKKGVRFLLEKGAGIFAGFPDSEYQEAGGALLEVVDSKGAHGADIVLKVNRPNGIESAFLKSGSLLIALMEPYNRDPLLEKIVTAGVGVMSMELIPRTSRAQSMDALSSQANVAGYRAVLEAATQYGRFLPMMMTAAGSAKPAKLVVLGVGVAGLQAIGTARRLGASVEAYDIRPEVREQILSLGAKFIDIQVGEEGSGTGGYARELSEDAKKKQQALLTERLKKADIIITTANIPGRKAPTLVTEEAVRGMRAGSVIIDMAAGSGGNCPLTVVNEVVIQHGVKIVGITNYPSLVPTDSSSFYARNILNLLELIILVKDGAPSIHLGLEDDIIDAALIIHQGKFRR